jgi:hydroxyethylthiazole kinase-like sugar kinase family protein
MKLFRTSLLLSMAIAPVWLSGCSSGPAGPTAATVELTFTTAADDDGAVLFTISGGPVDSVEAAGYALYLARLDPNTMRVIVAGDLTSGVIARLHIPDNQQRPQYSVTINQVAARVSYAQRQPESYSLALAP